MQINAASHSRLSVFEECKFRAKLQFIDKIPEPDRGPGPLPGGEWHNDRGTRIHNDAEAFVKGERDKLPIEAKDFRAELEKAREIFVSGEATTEEMWCYDYDWIPCDQWAFDEIVFRIKVDLTCFLTPTKAAVVDYKSGKSWGNELKHGEQLQLYAFGTALRYPAIEEIVTEAWYFDQNEMKSVKYTRDQALRFGKKWKERTKSIINESKFPPNPNRESCRWCPYKAGPIGKDRYGSGDCKVGVS